jgi:hypothetical protein
LIEGQLEPGGDDLKPKSKAKVKKKLKLNWWSWCESLKGKRKVKNERKK